MVGIGQNDIAAKCMEAFYFFSKSPMVINAELLFSVSLEVSVFRDRDIRRIKEYEIPWHGILFKDIKVITTNDVRGLQNL